jgi:hypothetical protein
MTEVLGALALEMCASMVMAGALAVARWMWEKATRPGAATS